MNQINNKKSTVIIPIEVYMDLEKYLKIIENYLKGEHDHETDAIQEKEDWDLYQEAIRLRELLSKCK